MQSFRSLAAEVRQLEAVQRRLSEIGASGRELTGDERAALAGIVRQYQRDHPAEYAAGLRSQATEIVHRCEAEGRLMTAEEEAIVDSAYRLTYGEE